MNLNDINQRMLRNIFLNTELLINDGIHELAEYDIQAFMFIFFRRVLANTNATAKREASGKVDCVVEENGKPQVFYELKTYFKKHEKPTKEHFDNDISKLAQLITNNVDSRGYFIISGRKSAFTPARLKNFLWLSERIHEKKKNWRTYNCNDGNSVKLRPSQLQDRGRSIALSWEVKL